MPVLIRGGRVLLAGDSILTRADILTEGDRIAAIAPELARPAGAEVLEASGHIILPGLINAHTHAQNNVMRGVGDRWTLEDQLNYAQALNAGRTVEDQYVSAALNAVEMLKTGCTAAYDLFVAIPAPTDAEVEAVVSGYVDVGLRAVVAPTISDVTFRQTVPGLLELLPAHLLPTISSLAPAPTERLLELAAQAVRRWDGAGSGRIRLAVAPTIPNLCSDELLSGCARIVREYGVPLHTHLAETKVQAVYAQQHWGETIVSRLARLGVLGPRFVGAHAVWLTDDDIRQMADAGAGVAHNPASNLKLGSGIPPVREMLDHGITVGIGTDGSMSSDNQNMFEAARFAAYVNRVRFPHEPTRWLGAGEVWDLATMGSARVLGMSADVGAIAPGRKADIVLMRGGSVFLRPLNSVLNAMVYVEPGTSVETVLVDGRIVLRAGQVLGVNEQSLLARAESAVERWRAANTEAWTLAEQFEPYIRAACRAAAAAPFPIDRYAGPPLADDSSISQPRSLER